MTILTAQRSIEQIAITSKGSRIIGFTSVRHGSGVSTISRSVAKAIAQSGSKTLLVPLAALQEAPPLVKTDTKAGGHLRASVAPSPHGYHLVAESSAALKSINAVRLREMLDTEFSDYDRIVMDLAPICDPAAGDGPGTVALSAVCDRLLLVCVIGNDRGREVTEAVSLLRSAGAPLSEIVSNEYARVDFWNVIRRRSKTAAAH